MTHAETTLMLRFVEALRSLFSDPARHTTGVHARDAGGKSVLPTNTTAVCWCLTGGILRTQSLARDAEAWIKTSHRVNEFINDLSLREFNLLSVTANDFVGYAGVQRLLNLAAEQLQQQLANQLQAEGK